MTPKIRFILASVLAAAALGAIAPAANAYVYWTNQSSGTIGRANNDGSSPDQSFITGANPPFGVAVDDNYIYWTNQSSGTIGRAKLDGTGVNQSFITGASDPAGVAVDDSYIYWTNLGTNTIGQANLNGSSPDQSIIDAIASFGVALRSQYVYWTNNFNYIGQAHFYNAIVSDVNQSFITTTGLPRGIAIPDQHILTTRAGHSCGSPSCDHIYWTNFTENTIGRSGINGDSPDQSFITGATTPSGVAVDGNHIYWTNLTTNTIGRADLDGSNPDQSIITGASSPAGVAVDSQSDPTLAKITKGGEFVTVKVGCGNQSACTLKLTGKKVGTNAVISPRIVSVGAGERPTVRLRYSSRLVRALYDAARNGRTSRVLVTATNTVGGGVDSITLRYRHRPVRR